MPETLDEIKKYVGPFSGPQMDQIFYEILNYTSERFAKGTAGGVPVAAGTPGYNDNSLFYKNQAAAQVSLAQAAAADAANSAQRAESAVPAGTDAAVLWTRDQSTELTADDKAVARKNIMAGGSNRNLIPNPWFTINQRKATSGIGDLSYCSDRWRAYNCSWVVNSDKTISLTFTGSGAGILTIIPFEADMVGKNFTLSVMLANGEVYSGTVAAPSSGVVQTGIFNNLRMGLSVTQNGRYQITLYLLSGSATIKAMKLEKGSVSTLANDAPPCYEEELAKCQRDLLRVTCPAGGFVPFAAIGYVTSASSVRFAIATPVTMSAKPTVSYTADMQVHGNGTAANVTALTVISIYENSVVVEATIEGSLAVNSIQSLAARGGYIDFSVAI